MHAEVNLTLSAFWLIKDCNFTLHPSARGVRFSCQTSCSSVTVVLMGTSLQA